MPLHDSLVDRKAVPLPDPLPAPVADAHTHLDACGFDTAAQVAVAMQRAATVGVRKVVTVGDDLASAQWAAEAATWHPDLYAAVALHPTRADALDNHARSVLEDLARHPRVVAVGETGLDHYWEAAPHAAQVEAFAWHIDLAKRVGKPLMIHDRDAHQLVLDVLDTEGAPNTVVFHCFSGDVAMARRCADAGYYLSFAGPVSFRNAKGLAEAAIFAPAELIMTETDAPFLTPHPHRGTRNEPAALPYTVRALAALRGEDLTKLCTAVSLTTAAVYGWDPPPAS
jgi:TatD DNase family protein